MKINIVLFEPEIPQNTGNIMRSCVGFNAKLHLIKPLGFRLDENHLRRATLDYFDYLDYEVYDDINDFYQKNPDAYIFYITRYGKKNPDEIELDKTKENVYFMFGRESTGIPYDILAKNLDNCIRIPTTDKIRSLNLSNCAAIILFAAQSKLKYEGLFENEPETLKGANFLDQFK